jgi:hypothetical protein
MSGRKKDARYNVVSFRISDDEIESFKTICSLSNKSISDLLREALQLYDSKLLDVNRPQG